MSIMSKVKLTAVVVMAGVSGGAIGYALGKKAGIKSLEDETLTEELEVEVVEVTENTEETEAEDEVAVEKEEIVQEDKSEDK